MKFKKTIGILGGMGPEASLNMYKTIINLCQDKYNCQQDFDFPKIIIYNLPLIGFDETGIRNKILVKSQLIQAAQKIELAGSDFLIIACNTVHYFQKDIEEVINIPLISMIDETVKKVQEHNFKTVSVLSSASTTTLGLYAKVLNNRGIEVVGLTKQQQEIINKSIFNVMQNKNNKLDSKNIKNIINSVVSLGVEAVILGCTELPLLISQKDIAVKLFNSTEITSNEALQYSLGK
ncbi:MAG: amino acid racemase [Candidatus Komeilibacteria bacterium]|jgi:aspartate racemase|nr:amino acid racemase [Candidatus Komeilibacteria bacterium]MBT4447451.1 amino acid racemase [Candidatus Komeilibacteria bacterium]